jgi:integrase
VRSTKLEPAIFSFVVRSDVFLVVRRGLGNCLSIKPALGQRKLKNLAPDHVQYFYQSKLDAGFAPGTARLMHGILHKALEQAVRWGNIPPNVCKATTPPKPDPEEIHPRDAEQAKRILEAARGNRLEAVYVLAVTAGLRIGELLGLKWKAIDLDAETLHVRRTRSQAKSDLTSRTFKLERVVVNKKDVEKLTRIRAQVSTFLVPSVPLFAETVAILDPANDLPSGTYQVTITNRVTDMAGNPLEPMSWRFTVVEDSPV